MSLLNVVDFTPILSIIPKEGKEQQVYDALKNAHPNLTIYWKNEIPERWHYQNNRRIMPIIGVADDGWSVSTSDYFNSHTSSFNGGTHGYDNMLLTQQAIFIGNGPAFKEGGLSVEPFDNLHVYSLMCHILNLEPAPNNGSLSGVQNLLK